MREEIELHGIVLSSGLQGDYDKRLVILTKERGRITAFASGVRRGTNPLQSKTQMFVMGSFKLIPGRNSYRLTGIDVDEYFHELTADIDAYCYASYFCEVMGFFTHEGMVATDYLNLLYVSMNALKKGIVSKKLIRCVYEIKLMDVFGQGIQSFSCPVCGNEELTYVFDASAGGILCKDCLKKAKAPLTLSETARYTIQYINSAPLGGLYNFSVTDEVTEEIQRVTKQFMDVYVDKKFKAADIIDSLQ
jgi:DNA repair protein RecO (recombination protein O)